MSTPYHYTPRVPAPPHPTPFSTSSHALVKPKTSRAPIQNPYEKFTQPEFDAWIGGITGALRRALGEDEQLQLEGPKRLDAHGGTLPRYSQLELGDEADEVADDSFAEIKARRAGKGKARDPRDGPGFGNGNRVQPIEIVSSDEEDEDEVQELAVNLEGGLEDEEEEEVERNNDDDSDEEDNFTDEKQSWDAGESSSYALSPPVKIGPPRKTKPKQVEEEDEKEDEYEMEYEEEYDEEDGEEYYDEEDDEETQFATGGSPEVIELVSDEEEEPQHETKAQELAKEEDGDGDGELDEEYDEYEEEDQNNVRDLNQPGRSFETLVKPRVVDGGQYGLQEEEEYDEYEEYDRDDYEVGEYGEGDEEDGVLEENEGVEDMQPLQDDTSFPPRRGLPDSCSRAPPDIHDPWSGPRTYAEDFYSGGDIGFQPGTEIDPNRLSSLDGTPAHEPQLYAPKEDFKILYADEEEIYSESQPKDIDDLQPLNHDTSFPPHEVDESGPVDIPDAWEGPEVYAQDFYSGGDVRTLPGIPIDPSHLSGTADEDSGIDAFLTPGGLTPIPNDLRSDQEDEEFEDDQEIIPPSHYVPATLSKRDSPIPADAEIFTIDDSDEDQQKEREQSVEEEFDELEHDDQMEAQDPRGIYGNVDEEADVEVVLPLDFTGDAVPDDISVAEPNQAERPHISMPESHRTQESSIVEHVEDAPLAIQVDNQATNGGLGTGFLNNEMPLNDLLQDATTVAEDPQALADKIPVDAESVSVPLMENIPLEEDDFDDMYATPAPEAASMHSDKLQTSTEEVISIMQDTDTIESEDKSTDDAVAHLPAEGSGLPDAETSAGSDASSAPDLGESAPQPVLVLAAPAPAPHPVVNNSSHVHDSGQLPTPPSEGVRYIPLPEIRESPEPSSATSQQVEIEEISEGDNHLTTRPAKGDRMNFGGEIDSGVGDVVVEEEDGSETYETHLVESHHDVDVEILSVVNSEDGWPLMDVENHEGGYVVEEPLTEGRLTEEPDDRGMTPEASGVAEEATMHESRIEYEATVVEDVSEGKDRSDLGEFQLGEEDSHTMDILPAEDEPTSSPVTQQVPMPVTANAEVADPTDQLPTPSRRQPNFIINIPGTPKFILSPVNTPRPAGEVIPVSVSLPPSVLRALKQQPSSPGPSQILAQASVASTQSDGLFTPAEASRTITPSDPIEDPHRQALDKLAEVLLGHVPVYPEGESSATALREPSLPDLPPQLRLDSLAADETALQSPHIDDILGDIPGFDALQNLHDSPSPVALSRRTPSVFMGVTLSRRSTDPVLMADPYPYSLSTPGSGLPPVHDEGSEEDAALDNSMSSNSTMEKETGGKDSLDLLDDEELELQYPPGVDFFSGSQDVNLSRTDFNAPPAAATLQFEEIIQADDPFKLMGTDSAIAPGPVENDENPSDINTPLVPQPATPAEPVHKAVSLQDNSSQMSIVSPALDSANGDSSKRLTKRKRDSSPDFEKRAEKSASKGKGKKGSKADRKGKANDTKANTERIVEDIIHVRPRQNSKQDPSAKTETTEKSSASSSRGRKGSGLMAASLIQKTNSRASSVVSSTPSEQSLTSQPSPTTNKPHGQVPALPPPTSLFHAHGQKRKTSYSHFFNQPKAQPRPIFRPILPRASSSPQIVEQRSATPLAPAVSQTTQSVPLLPEPSAPSLSLEPLDSTIPADPTTPIIESASTITVEPHSEKPPNSNATPSTPSNHSEESVSQVPPAPSVTSHSHTPSHTSTPAIPAKSITSSKPPARQLSMPQPTSTARSTRSQCRYHRISLPKEEGGPRICFLVPGCCLNDRELIDEEEIEDHGDATEADSRRMIKDVESLDFDENLIGILRQLVGLDILREQEVFYLPQPGEEVPVRRVPVPKSISERLPSKSHADSGSYAGSPGYSGSTRSPASTSIRPPLSNADSTSTSRSVLRKLLDPEKGSSIAETESESESSEDNEPSAKRTRSSPADDMEMGVMGPPTSSKSKGKTKPRKSKVKDVTYKPTEDEEDPIEEHNSTKKRRKSTRRNLKRTRTMDPAGEEGERKAKKLRKHVTAPEVTSPNKEESGTFQ